MEKQTSLRADRPDAAAGGGENGTAPRRASVATRSMIGLCLIVMVAGVLWVDYYGLWRLLPNGAEGLTGLRTLLEGGLVLGVVGAALVGLGLREYESMARRLGAEMPRLFLILSGAALVLLQWPGWAYRATRPFLVCPTWLRQPGMTAMVIACGAALAMLGARAVQGRIRGSMPSTGMFGLGLLYVAVPFGFLGGVRTRWGVAGVLVVLAVSKSCDIGAYYCGKMIGGPKLAPRVSPRKTWAGAVGGFLLASAIGVALSLSPLRPYESFTPVVGAIFGALGAVVSMVGDLAASVLKREADVKDSGNVLPGTGGFIDMVDGILFALPFSYLFFLATYA